MASKISNITVTLRYLRIPSRKVRFVADLVKGLPVMEAEARLMVTPRRPKEPVVKLLRSAIANAENNHHIEKQNLFIKEIRVDGGPMFKRWITRARGGVDPIQKKTSHVTLTLGVSEKPMGKAFTIVKKEKKAKALKEAATEEKQPKANGEPALKEMKEMSEKKPTKEPGDGLRKIFRRKAI